MELPRLIVLTCVLGVCAALCYARGAPAREVPAPSPSVVAAAFPPPPSLPTATAPTAVGATAPKPVLPRTKAQKRRSR